MSWVPDTTSKCSTSLSPSASSCTFLTRKLGDSFAANTDGFEPDNAGFNADATSDNWNGEGDTAPAEGDDSGEGARRCRKYDAQALFNALLTGHLHRHLRPSCDQIGHLSRDCPEPKKLTGECFNCGEVGHNKADCPNPKVARPFTGECRICHKEGHPAAECPDKPADKCRICGQEGT